MTAKKGISAKVIDGALEGMSVDLNQGALSRGYVDATLTQTAVMPEIDIPNPQIRYYIFQTGPREFVLSIKRFTRKQFSHAIIHHKR